MLKYCGDVVTIESSGEEGKQMLHAWVIEERGGGGGGGGGL